MDKKKIVLSISLIVFMIVVIIIYNLVIRKNDKGNTNTIDQNIINEPSNKSVIDRINGTTTCRNVNNYYNTLVFTSKNDKVVKCKATAVKQLSTYGFDTIEQLTQADKNSIESEILKELNIDSFEYKGINISVEYNMGVALTVDIDYSNYDMSVIEKLGLKFNGKYSNIIKNLLSTKEWKCE